LPRDENDRPKNLAVKGNDRTRLLDLIAILKTLPQLTLHHSQSAVVIWEKYLDLCEMEQLFPGHLHDETACATLSVGLLQIQDFPIYE
jgi:hypothetical protein